MVCSCVVPSKRVLLQINLVPRVFSLSNIAAVGGLLPTIRHFENVEEKALGTRLAVNNILLMRSWNHVFERKMADRFPELPGSD